MLMKIIWLQIEGYKMKKTIKRKKPKVLGFINNWLIERKINRVKTTTLNESK